VGGASPAPAPVGVSNPNPNPNFNSKFNYTEHQTVETTLDQALDQPSDALTFEQALETIRSNARFTEMKSALDRDPFKFSKQILGFIRNLSPGMAAAVERYGVAILRQVYEEVQFFFHIHSLFSLKLLKSKH
jgi:hypothetical protein